MGINLKTNIPPLIRPVEKAELKKAAAAKKAADAKKAAAAKKAAKRAADVVRNTVATTVRNALLPEISLPSRNPITPDFLRDLLTSEIKIAKIPKIPIATPIEGRNNGTKLDISGDTFNASEIAINNGEFKPTGGLTGITVLRPEIISLFNFYPIFNNKTGNRILNSYGKFIEINFQSSYLHRDSVVELVSNIEKSLSDNTATNSVKNAIKKINDLGTQKNLDNISKILTYENKILSVLHTIEDSFDIKSIGETPFKINNSLSILQLYTQRMGYTKEQFNRFTNSKIYSQMIIDLRNILENYSFGLLGLADKDRIKDFDPIKLDKTYTITDDSFTFKITQLGNSTKTIDAVSLKTFDSFQNSLPKEPVNRIRLLVTLLSKEFRVSKALGNKDVSKQIKDRFGVGSVGSPFENMLGVPANDILDRSSGGNNNLASLAFIDVDKSLQLNKNYNKDMFVLPFEKKYIDSTIKKTSTYIPGSSYFVDSILHTTGDTLNLEPLRSYIGLFEGTARTTQDSIKLLLDLKERQTNLLPDKFYKHLLGTMYTGLYSSNSFEINSQNDKTTSEDSASAILMALGKLANKDRGLNHLLFQYYILAGINLNKKSDIVGGELWDGLANEISDIRNIPFFKSSLDVTFETKNPSLSTSFNLKNEGSTNSLAWALKMLAEAIEKKVASIILKKKKLPETPYVFVDIGSPQPAIQLEPYIKDINKLIPGFELRNLNLTNGSIAEKLAVAANSNGVIKSFVDFMTWISKQSKTDNSFVVPDGSYRTRFNFLSTSSVMLMTYEIFNSFINRYLFSEFIAVEKGSNLMVIWDQKANSAVFSASKSIAGSENITTNDNTNSLINNVSTPPRKSKAGEVQVSSTPRQVGTTKKETTTIKQKISPLPVKKYASKLLPPESVIKNANLSFIQALGDTVSYIKKNTFLSLETDKLIINLVDELSKNKEKLLEEEHTIECMLNAINVISSRFLNSWYLASGTFTKEKIDASLLDLSFLKKKNSVETTAEAQKVTPEDFEYPYTIEQLKKISDVQQLQLSWNVYNTFQDRFTTKYDETVKNAGKPFVAINIVHKDVKNTLYSYLASADLSEQNEASTRMKILTVGIPAGFRSNLVDRLSLNSVTRTKKDLLIEKQIDLIKINVYKRETRYSDIIFKPQTFIFDLSMFQLQSGIISAKPSVTDNFENILNKIILKNYELNNGTISPFSISLLENKLLNSYSINSMQSYNLISDAQKKQLIKNHVISYLLESYINLLSGVKMNEETFTEDNSKFDLYGPNGSSESMHEQNFSILLKTYLKDVLKENIPEGKGLWYLTKREDVSDNVKDIVRTLTFGNDFFVPGLVRSKILNPKTFERVFNLPINIDKFEVDIEETNKTYSGTKTLVQARTQNLLREVGTDKITTYFNKRDKSDIILEDLFITIENMV